MATCAGTAITHVVNKFKPHRILIVDELLGIGKSLSTPKLSCSTERISPKPPRGSGACSGGGSTMFVLALLLVATTSLAENPCPLDVAGCGGVTGSVLAVDYQCAVDVDASLTSITGCCTYLNGAYLVGDIPDGMNTVGLQVFAEASIAELTEIACGRQTRFSGPTVTVTVGSGDSGGTSGGTSGGSSWVFGWDSASYDEFNNKRNVAMDGSGISKRMLVSVEREAATCPLCGADGSTGGADPSSGPNNSGTSTADSANEGNASPWGQDKTDYSGSDNGCIGVSTSHSGRDVRQIMRDSGLQEMYRLGEGRRMTVLCTGSVSRGRLCATPNHVVMVGGARVTMREVCNGRRCYSEVEEVLNFKGPRSVDFLEVGEWNVTNLVVGTMYYRAVERVGLWESAPPWAVRLLRVLTQI